MSVCYIPHRESNYYSVFGLDHNDPFVDLCQDILSFEKLGKVLIVGDLNARVGNYQNMDSEEDLVDTSLLRDSKDCIVSDYGRLLIHMLNCTNMTILNASKAFPLTSDFMCLAASG